MTQHIFDPGVGWPLYTNIETAPGSLVAPFNPDRVAELVNAGLAAIGLPIPPVAYLGCGSGDTLIGVGIKNPTEQQISNIMATLLAVCTNPTRNNQTQEQITAAYIQLDLDYKQVFINASNILETGLMAGVSTLAAYRTVLNNTIIALVPLAGTRFETHFNVERTAQGLPPSLVPNSMTLAQCAQFDTLLHVWLNARKIDAVIAQLTL